MTHTLIHPDVKGFYGNFGGAYVPEMLWPNVQELQERYHTILEDPSYRDEYDRLLREYAGRPTPLYFAERLSQHYNTRIFLKREDLAHTGAHKINNALGQILLARRLGKKRIIAETGAGQHGVATATVCARMGMSCTVYMGALDVQRQRPNVERMKLLGASVVPVTSGNQTLKDAVNEALRDWITHPGETYYLIGSVVGPHPYPDLVARLQSVISEELLWQFPERTDKALPDVILACVGGGSNAAGAFYHYLDKPQVRLIAAEAGGRGVDSGETAATIALGHTGILHGSLSYVIQDDDGQIIEPYSISAGLDYPGIGPLLSHLFTTGRAAFHTVDDDEALRAARFLARQEGIIPALESAHAFALLEKIPFGPEENIIINLSGRGDKDMETILKNIEY
jgi:tryptophan synthase beta chain